MLAAITWLATGAGAQVAGDTLARLRVDGAALRTGDVAYQLSLTANEQVQSLGERIVTTTASTYAGVPSWLIVATGGRGVLESLDSLYLARDGLQPLHWSSTLGTARVAVAFALDTVFGATSTPVGRQNIVLPNPGKLVVTSEMLDALLQLEPLAVAWRDSVMMLIVDPVTTVVAPVALSVEGEERVNVPAGSFDCWIVSAAAQRGEAQLWVSKTGHTVVRSLQRLPQLGDAMLERVLLRSTPPF